MNTVADAASGRGVMLANPRVGQLVEIRYRSNGKGGLPAPSSFMPLHGRCGVVAIVGKGKPRNHGVEVDGVMYVVPCGNLMAVVEG